MRSGAANRRAWNDTGDNNDDRTAAGFRIALPGGEAISARSFIGNKRQLMLKCLIFYLVSDHMNKPISREFAPDRDNAMERKTDETFRSDYRSAACFAGHDRIRVRQAGHGPDGRAGWRRD
jgi:hypothetical protein